MIGVVQPDGEESAEYASHGAVKSHGGAERTVCRWIFTMSTLNVCILNYTQPTLRAIVWSNWKLLGFSFELPVQREGLSLLLCLQHLGQCLAHSGLECLVLNQ